MTNVEIDEDEISAKVQWFLDNAEDFDELCELVEADAARILDDHLGRLEAMLDAGNTELAAESVLTLEAAAGGYRLPERFYRLRRRIGVTT